MTFEDMSSAIFRRHRSLGFALRNAGRPDDRPVWTGSLPLSAFQRGRQSAKAEPTIATSGRHGIASSASVALQSSFGEQVEAAIGHGWLDAVSD